LFYNAEGQATIAPTDYAASIVRYFTATICRHNRNESRFPADNKCRNENDAMKIPSTRYCTNEVRQKEIYTETMRENTKER